MLQLRALSNIQCSWYLTISCKLS